MNLKLKVSLIFIPVLLGEDTDFFNINADCSVENCSILILIFIILFGTLLSIGLFLIIKRMRSRNSRIYVQVRAIKVKNIEKDRQMHNDDSVEYYDLMNNNKNFEHILKKMPQKVPNDNKIEAVEESNRKNHSNLSTAKPKENEIYLIKLENELQAQMAGKDLNIQSGTQNLISKNDSENSKSSKNNFFNEKLNNKSHMFADDSSIQFEQDSCYDISIESSDQNFSSFEEKKLEILGDCQPYLDGDKNQKQDRDFDNLQITKVQQTFEECNRLKTIIEENEGMVETVRGNNKKNIIKKN